MAALTAAMLALSAANTLNGYTAQRRGAKAAIAQGNYAGSVYDQNAAYAESQAADATARGTQTELKYRGEVKQLRGTQRAAYAAQGIDVNSGSAEDVQADTEALGELDALTIRNNARREAYGFEVEGAGFRSQAALARAGGENEAAALRSQANSTLLTGAADFYNVYRNRPQNIKKVGEVPTVPQRVPDYKVPGTRLTPNTPQRMKKIGGGY